MVIVKYGVKKLSKNIKMVTIWKAYFVLLV